MSMMTQESHEDFMARIRRRNEAGLRNLAGLGLFALNHDVFPETRETEELMPIDVVLLDRKTMQPLSHGERLRWFHENGRSWA